MEAVFEEKRKFTIGCSCETPNIKLNKSVRSRCLTLCDVCSEKQFLKASRAGIINNNTNVVTH